MSVDVAGCGFRAGRSDNRAKRFAAALDQKATRTTSVQRVLANHFWCGRHDSRRDAEIVALDLDG